MANIAEHLNDLVVTGEKDPKFRIMCCMNWKKFRDGEGLGDDLARYAREAFPNGASTEQIAAIRSFPTEPLRLLRQVVILALDCPRDPPEKDPPRPPPITLRFQSEQCGDDLASIRVDISGNNEMMVTFRAAHIV